MVSRALKSNKSSECQIFPWLPSLAIFQEHFNEDMKLQNLKLQFVVQTIQIHSKTLLKFE